MKTFFAKLWKNIVAHKVLSIVTASLLSLVIIFSCLGAFIFNRYSKGILPDEQDIATLRDNNLVYEHVVIFGVDGAGAYFNECDTPSFDRIYKEGSVTYTALSQTPTISAQNWTSMLHGVRYQKHHIDNGKASNQNYTDPTYPSVFKVYSERHPDATFVSVVNWAPINKGIIERDLSGMHKIDAGSAGYYDGEDDGNLIDQNVAVQAVKFIQTNEPTIMFLQFDNVDHAGHSSGYGSESFATALKNTDNYIDMVYQAYVDKGWGDNTLFITVSDHGHTKIGGHGGNSTTEKNVTIAVAGGKGNIVKGTPGKSVTQDIASIVMYALGEQQPESWESRVPTNMFTTLTK